MTEDPWMSQVEAFGRFVTGQRRLAQRRLRELSARHAQRQVMLATRQSQRPVVEAVGIWSSLFERGTPTFAPLPDARQPRTVVRGGFELAEQVLTMQRTFAERLLVAARPVLDKKA